MPAATPTVPEEWAQAGRLPRKTLLQTAVARGCRHYAPLHSFEVAPADLPELPHEVLGAALLRGPEDTETFQAIRCGAMVLSDLGNAPQKIRDAGEYFGVSHRIAHIARLALTADGHPEFWTAILNLLPSGPAPEPFLPDVSRLTSETRMGDPRGSPARVWLRTRYAVA